MIHETSHISLYDDQLNFRVDDDLKYFRAISKCQL